MTLRQFRLYSEAAAREELRELRRALVAGRVVQADEKAFARVLALLPE